MNSRYIFAGIFLFVLYWVAYLYKPFLLAISIASLLAIATSNINIKLNKVLKYKVLAATLSTLLLSILFFAPIVYTMNSFAMLINNFDPIYVDKIISLKQDFMLPEYLNFAKPQIEQFLSGLNTQDITKQILEFITMAVKKSAGFLKDMIVILIFYFFVNLYSKELVKYIKSIFPVDRNSYIFFEISNVMSVVFYSILITAMFEGALFAIIASFFGYDALLFGILYGFASLIPIIGGAIMWIPLALYEYANGNLFATVFIAVYSIVMISTIADTFIKPLIIKYINTKFVRMAANLNELLIFFSIIAGLTTFGFWGMILGPAITTFFISLLKIYKELLNDEKKNIY